MYDLHGSTDVSVHSVHVLCAQCDIPEYTELDDEEVYSFLTSQYLAEGGDGYDLSKAIIVTPGESLYIYYLLFYVYRFMAPHLITSAITQ